MGNRVKGRVKRKSVKAASQSGMGSKRTGKVRKKNHSGMDATFVGRSACLKRLRTSFKRARSVVVEEPIPTD